MMDEKVVLDELPETECHALLAAHHFGRLAVESDGWPLIMPVNYVFDGRRIAIRTDCGTKLLAAPLSRVAFEVEEVEDTERAGWSVVVTGVAHEVTDALDEVSETMRQLLVEPWAPGQKAHWIRVDPRRITGRRLRRAVEGQTGPGD